MMALLCTARKKLTALEHMCDFNVLRDCLSWLQPALRFGLLCGADASTIVVGTIGRRGTDLRCVAACFTLLFQARVGKGEPRTAASHGGFSSLQSSDVFYINAQLSMSDCVTDCHCLSLECPGP
jgi:hypothetical protein